MKVKQDNDFLLKLNLQRFAEGGEGGDEGGEGGDEGGQGKTEPTIDELLADEKFKAEFEKRLQSEADKRVTDAIKKTTTKLKTEYDEKMRKQKLSEEELRKEEELKKQQEINAKLRNARQKELQYTLVDVLNEQKLDLGLRALVNVNALIDIEDEEQALTELKALVENTHKVVDEITNRKLEEYKAELLKGNSPELKGGGKPLDDYSKAQQNKDVRGMLYAKMNKLNS